MRPRFFTILLFLSFVSITGYTQDPTTVRKKQFNLDGGVAIEGYDPVAYFKVNKAVKGKKELAVYHQGVTYYFSSTENKEDFKRHLLNTSPNTVAGVHMLWEIKEKKSV